MAGWVPSMASQCTANDGAAGSADGAALATSATLRVRSSRAMSPGDTDRKLFRPCKSADRTCTSRRYQTKQQGKANVEPELMQRVL